MFCVIKYLAHSTCDQFCSMGPLQAHFWMTTTARENRWLNSCLSAKENLVLINFRELVNKPTLHRFIKYVPWSSIGPELQDCRFKKARSWIKCTCEHSCNVKEWPPFQIRTDGIPLDKSDCSEGHYLNWYNSRRVAYWRKMIIFLQIFAFFLRQILNVNLKPFGGHPLGPAHLVMRSNPVQDCKS